MKKISSILLIASCITVFAVGPEYSSLREWVEQHHAKDKTPADERIFVNFDWKDSAIVRYHKGMKLQEILQKPQFRDREFYVEVFRAAHKPLGEPIYDELRKSKQDRAGFAVQPLEVIYLSDGDRN